MKSASESRVVEAAAAVAASCIRKIVVIWRMTSQTQVEQHDVGKLCVLEIGICAAPCMLFKHRTAAKVFLHVREDLRRWEEEDRGLT